MSGKAGYAEIASHFRSLITDGTFAPGDALPAMSKVRKQFGASITTVNRAFAMLKSEGLTEARPGSGTFVADQSDAPATAAARLKRMDRTGMQYAHKETSTNHEVWRRSIDDPQIEKLMELEPHDEVVIRKRVFRNDGKPTVVAISCINIRALQSVPELTSPEPFRHFWQKTYTERTGIVTTRSPERRTARFASADELDALEIQTPPESAVPVLVLVNVFHDEQGPLEYWEDVYAPGLWQIDSE